MPDIAPDTSALAKATKEAGELVESQASRGANYVMLPVDTVRELVTAARAALDVARESEESRCLIPK